MNILQQQAEVIREKALATSGYDISYLRQQLADSEASRKAEARGTLSV